MKRKTYTFEQEKKSKNTSYTQEIKEILTNNPQIETVAEYDKNGNYTITLMIPDWKDRWKSNTSKQIPKNDVGMRQYGNYQQTKGYRSFESR